MSTGIGVRGTQLVGAMVLTYLLLPEVVGEVGVAVLLAVMVNQLSMLGVPQYIVTRKKLEPTVPWHGLVIVLGVAGALIGLCLVLAEPLGALLREGLNAPNIVDYIPGAILSMVLFRVGLIPERLLQRQMKFRAISLIRAVAELSYTAASLTLAAMGLGGMAIVAAHVTRHGLLLVLMSCKAGLRAWLKPRRLEMATFRRILSFGLPFSVAGFLARVGQQGDKPLMSGVFNPAAAGTYQLAYNLADIPAVQVGEQIIDVLTPSLAQSEQEERKRELVRATALSALVVFPLAIGLGAVAHTLVASFLRKEWAEVAPMLTVLSVLAVFRPIGWTIGTYLSATDRPKVQMALSIVAVVVLFSGMVGLGILGGPLWACAAVGIAFAVHALASVGYVSAVDGIPIGHFARGFFRPLGACLPMVAAVLAVRYGLELAGFWVRGVNLALEVLAGAVAYIGGALVIARPLAQELIALVKEAIRRRRGPASVEPPSSKASAPGEPTSTRER